MKSIICDWGTKENLGRYVIVLILFVTLLSSHPLNSFSQENRLFIDSSENRSANSAINYRNPLEYDLKYIFELYPDFKIIDKNRDLKLWIPMPREWDSQKNVRIVSINPQPDSIYTDPEYGNKFAFWDFGSYPEKPFYRIELRVRLESYEIDTWIDTSLIKPYDKTSNEYALYTSSGPTIEITPKVKEFAKEAIGDEKNPYLQAKKIYEFVRNKVRYNIVEHERGRGISALLDFPFTDKKTGVEYYEGSCSQFCAFFIAMCRSVGIPSRSVFGFIGEKVYKREEELKQPVFPFEKQLSPEGLSGAQHHGVMGPHMWAEFYLQDIGWVPLDPTAGIFGQLYGEKVIQGKGRDIRFGPAAPQATDNGYGSQFKLIHDGRVDYPLYGVYNIASIQTAKVKIIHLSDKKQIVEELYRTMLEQDLANTKKQYQELKEKFTDDYDFSKEQLNMLGNKLRFEKRFKEAIEIYNWIIELYPDWWGAYRGLADVYNYKGDKEMAIKYYARSLELNPTKLNARLIIELLKNLIEY